MRAVILAAGEGRRLRPLTQDRPKCMVEYQGVPIIDYQLNAMKACGIKDIILIKGYCADAVVRPGVRYAYNKEYASTNMVYTFFCAEEYFDDDIIVSYGDIIYGKSVLEPLLKAKGDFSVVVSMNWKELWQKRMENPLLDAETLKMNASGHIVELGKKPKSYDEIQGQYMGLFRIKRKAMEYVKDIYKSADAAGMYDGKDYRNMFMTTLIQMVIDSGFPVEAVKTDAQWLEIDQLDDLKVPLEIYE